MGYITRYLKVFRACGKVDGPHHTNRKWKWWDAFIGPEHYRFWQSDDSHIVRQRWVVPSSHLEPFWTSITKEYIFTDMVRTARHVLGVVDGIDGHLELLSYESAELVLRSRQMPYKVVLRDPVAVRLWGDYLLDQSVKNYLIDYLLDLSELFRRWYKP